MTSVENVFPHGGPRQSEYEYLFAIAHKRFPETLTNAEIQVLQHTVSSSELPSPEKYAACPETSYGTDTPRPEVRAAFLSWLATDLEARPYIPAKGLRVYSSTITGELDLSDQLQLPILDFRRCTAKDGINLADSQTNRLIFADCLLEKGIEASGLVVRGPVFLRRTVSQGQIRFVNATIESNLEWDGVKLNATKDALRLDGATIRGNVYFNESATIQGSEIVSEKFESLGHIMMLGTKVGGDVVCTGAKLSDTKFALTMDGAHITGNVLLNGGLQCPGTIRLLGCRIEGDLNFLGAKVNEVLCPNMVLSGDLKWCGVEKSELTSLDLRGARLKALRDDMASWPAQGNLELENLVYDTVILHDNQTNKQLDENQFNLAQEQPLNVAGRIAWLKLQSPTGRLRAQPWVQLSRHLESTNDKAGARKVLYDFHCLQAAGETWIFQRRVSIFLAWLEENPYRILWLVSVTLLIGTLIFSAADRSGAMISTAREKDGQPLAQTALKYYPPFSPFVYTLENALPLVKLGADDMWTPDPAHAGKAWFPQYPSLHWLRWFNSYGFLVNARRFIILFGWFQAAVLGAALTSRFKS